MRGPVRPNLTAGQQLALEQFRSVAVHCDGNEAGFYMHDANFDIQRAMALFYEANAGKKREYIAPLNKIFDNYRIASDPKDVFGIEGAMAFLTDIDVPLDNVAVLLVAEICQCPSLGEFTKAGFVNGWKLRRCKTVDQMRTHMDSLRTRFAVEHPLFRYIYRFSFNLCRLPGARTLGLDIATEQWQLFFDRAFGGIQANTSVTPWLDWWVEFLQQRNTRAINKDLWQQLEVFLRKAIGDENLSFWNVDEAWPAIIDEFVVFVKEKRGNTLLVAPPGDDIMNDVNP
ncbi:Cullin binding-domain-containing protein [Penicillium verhagenii]|nr:Cullin binding-domain-containing protein [Penicillium verhagenii]